MGKRMRKPAGILAAAMCMCCVCVCVGVATVANATLINNGNGLIYDTDLNITWYDYSYYDKWADAKNWADNLTITVNGVTYSDWRLPAADPSQGQIYSAVGEMGHLYYTELGNSKNAAGSGLVNTGPFQHLLASAYWSKDAYTGTDALNHHWDFWFNAGYQSIWGDFYSDGNYALAVHEGNVGAPVNAPVPEPATGALLGLSLAGLAALRGRLKTR